MANDIFLKLTGEDGKVIEGESTDAAFPGQIEIFNFSFGASNMPTIGSFTTGSSGSKVTLDDFSFSKYTDKSSTKAFTKCAEGKHFKSALVTVRKAGGEAGQQNFIQYFFEQVFVARISWSGAGDTIPVEQVSLAYGKVTLSYSPQKADGTLDPAIIAGWDATANVAYSGEIPK